MVFVGPTLWQLVTMAMGQTASSQGDCSTKGNIQDMGLLHILWKSFQLCSLATQSWGLNVPMSRAWDVSTVLGAGSWDGISSSL